MFGTAASGQGVYAEGVGTIVGKVFLDNHWVNTKLKEVYHVPACSLCLFSTGTIEKMGYILLQGGWQMSIFKSSSPLMFTLDTQNGYVVTGQKVLEAYYQFIQNVYYFNLVMDGSPLLQSTVDIWHWHFAHPGDTTLGKIPPNTKGVNNIDPRPEGHPACEGCAWGKSHCHSFPCSSLHATEPCHLIHSDLDGPMRTQSIDRYSYFCSFLDDYSDLAFIVYLKNKFSALDAFKMFKVWAENQTQKTVKRFRSD